MRRRLLILSCVVALAACTDAPPPSSGPPTGMRASFPPGGVVNVIKVDVLDPLPLRGAELVAPDGSATPANSLDVTANPQTLGGQHALADPWRPSMFGSNGPDPLPSNGLDPSDRSRDQLLLTVSTADITLPDPVAYRRDWAHYKIRLSFAGPGNELEAREIPAPEPPPEQAGSG